MQRVLLIQNLGKAHVAFRFSVFNTCIEWSNNNVKDLKMKSNKKTLSTLQNTLYLSIISYMSTYESIECFYE